MAGLVFCLDISAGKTAEDGAGSFQSRLDPLQNLSTGTIDHSG
jgi:hypothetical protein